MTEQIRLNITQNELKNIDRDEGVAGSSQKVAIPIRDVPNPAQTPSSHVLWVTFSVCMCLCVCGGGWPQGARQCGGVSVCFVEVTHET